MELGHLHTFVAVAEEKSITRAAQRLFTTPSAVSMQVKALETELSVQLFVRTSRGVELTEIGRQLKTKAQHTLQSARELAAFASETQHQVAGRVSLGLNSTSGFLRIAPLIVALSRQHPGVELHCINTNSGHVMDDVRQGRLDLGFVFGEVSGGGLAVQPLCTAALVIAAPRAWQSEIEAADWPTLAQMPWIYADYYCPFQALIDDLFAVRGLPYRRRVLSDQDSTKTDLVANGVGLTLMEESEARAHPDIIISPVDPIPCRLSLVSRLDRREEPTLKAVSQVVQAVWQRVQ